MRIRLAPGTGAYRPRAYPQRHRGIHICQPSQPVSETLVTLTVGDDEFLSKQIGLAEYKINETVYLTIDPNNSTCMTPRVRN
jgi:hypothetical protein